MASMIVQIIATAYEIEGSMQYWGKLAGLMSGLMSGAGWWGALLGVMAGHLFDRSLLARRHGTFTYQQTAPPFFFISLFR